jgi:hypothetical protein
MTKAEIRKEVKALCASDTGFPGCLGSTRGMSLAKPGKDRGISGLRPKSPAADKARRANAKLVAHLLAQCAGEEGLNGNTGSRLTMNPLAARPGAAKPPVAPASEPSA